MSFGMIMIMHVSGIHHMNNISAVFSFMDEYCKNTVLQTVQDAIFLLSNNRITVYPGLRNQKVQRRHQKKKKKKKPAKTDFITT